MKIVLIVLVLNQCFLSDTMASTQSRLVRQSKKNDDVAVTKRSVVQFGLMILEVTGRNPLDYNGYGCWCGYGGKGRPLDGVDGCCKQHDLCYNGLIYSKRYCGRYEVYHKNYYYSYTNGRLKCYTGWWSSRCGRSLCHCDVQAVECFKRNHFNNLYKDWNKNKCS